MTTTKVCSKCHKEFPATLEFFSKNMTSHTPLPPDKLHLRPECRDCHSRLTKGKAKAFKLAGKPNRPPLGTPCDFCKCTDRKLVFDHDHITLEHRGWLCDRCNRGFGMLGDDVESLEKGILYLKGGADAVSW